jgi:stage III sporulation protein AH
MSLKKNQIVIFVIGLMIITAGYLSYSTNSSLDKTVESSALLDSEEMASIGDAKLVSANVSSVNTIDEDVESINEINNTTNNSKYSNIIEENNLADDVVSNNIAESSDDYFINSRLERNTMYSQTIEAYQKILNNTNVSEAQKKTAQAEITKLTELQNEIMISENLIKTKGIDDLVIFVNNDSINVIVEGNEPKKDKIAQIQNIITRELEADIEDIHIMNKKSQD